MYYVEVQAQETDEEVYYPSYFFDNEVYLLDGSMSYFTEVEGYVVNKFYKTDAMSSYQSVTSNSIATEKDTYYDFMFEIVLPSTISKNTMFNLAVDFKYGGVASFGAMSVNYVRGDWLEYFSGSLSARYDYANTIYKVVSFEEVTAQNDIDRICIYFNDCKAATTSMTFYPLSVDITETSTNGLLSGIIEWIKSIKEGITELPNKIKSALTSLFDMVVNAITNLGNFIIDGIKGLFVPTNEDITEMQDDWNTLLEDRFGALYQAIDIIHDYAESFTASEKTTIDFPEVSVPLGDEEFVFGGWTIKVVPDGFSVIIDALKLMISIISTFAFVNAMKNRLEKLVGGADNI